MPEKWTTKKLKQKFHEKIFSAAAVLLLPNAQRKVSTHHLIFLLLLITIIYRNCKLLFITFIPERSIPTLQFEKQLKTCYYFVVAYGLKILFVLSNEVSLKLSINAWLQFSYNFIQINSFNTKIKNK